jgi:hypothetical protein
MLVVRPLAATLASAPSTVLPARVVDLEAQLAGASARGADRVASGAPPGAIARDRIDDTVHAIRSWLRQS